MLPLDVPPIDVGVVGGDHWRKYQDGRSTGVRQDFRVAAQDCPGYSEAPAMSGVGQKPGVRCQATPTAGVGCRERQPHQLRIQA